MGFPFVCFSTTDDPIFRAFVTAPSATAVREEIVARNQETLKRWVSAKNSFKPPKFSEREKERDAEVESADEQATMGCR